MMKVIAANEPAVHEKELLAPRAFGGAWSPNKPGDLNDICILLDL